MGTPFFAEKAKKRLSLKREPLLLVFFWSGGAVSHTSGVRTPFSVISIVQRISCSSTGTSGERSCSRQMSAVGQRSCGSRRS